MTARVHGALSAVPIWLGTLVNTLLLCYVTIIECNEEQALRVFRAEPHCHKACPGCDKPKCAQYHKVMVACVQIVNFTIAIYTALVFFTWNFNKFIASRRDPP